MLLEVAMSSTVSLEFQRHHSKNAIGPRTSCRPAFSGTRSTRNNLHTEATTHFDTARCCCLQAGLVGSITGSAVRAGGLIRGFLERCDRVEDAGERREEGADAHVETRVGDLGVFLDGRRVDLDLGHGGNGCTLTVAGRRLAFTSLPKTLRGNTHSLSDQLPDTSSFILGCFS